MVIYPNESNSNEVFVCLSNSSSVDGLDLLNLPSGLVLISIPRTYLFEVFCPALVPNITFNSLIVLSVPSGGIVVSAVPPAPSNPSITSAGVNLLSAGLVTFFFSVDGAFPINTLSPVR